MSFDQLGVEVLLASVQKDPDISALFADGGVQDRIRKLRQQQQLAGEKRRRVAAAVLNIFNSPDGAVLFDYLVGAYIRRFNNVTALGLPMETAIQFHAERDGQRELVQDLMRMINEARNPPSQPSTQEA